MSQDTRAQLAKAVVTWLKESTSSSQFSSSSDKQAQLNAAAESINNAFGLDQQPAVSGAANLQTIYDVFLKTQQKMGSTAPATSQADPVASSSASIAPPSPEDLAAADAHKTAGNKSMSSKDYGAAIASYTKAIDLNQSPIYYSNRAAAYSQIGQHEKAVEDAREAAKIDPNFGKAYSRLGHALFSSGKFDEAVEAYQQGLLVDPQNKLMQTGLETAKSQASKSSNSGSDNVEDIAASGSQAATRGAGAGAGAGGFPGMGGGMPDIASLMNNPMLQGMMANGGMDQLLNNPMLRGMAERMGAGGGGMPDMSQIQQMMRDPQMMAMARQFMGGMGGGGSGAAGGQGGAGSGSGRTGDDMFG